MNGPDITLEILTDLRAEMRGTNARLDGLMRRLDLVDVTLLDLAVEQALTGRQRRAVEERDAPLESRVSALEDRVAELESK